MTSLFIKITALAITNIVILYVYIQIIKEAMMLEKITKTTSAVERITLFSFITFICLGLMAITFLVANDLIK